MDPVTLAIITALAGGALTGAVTPPFVDAYNRLTGLVQRKFGEGSDIVEAIEGLARKPDSERRKSTVKEEASLRGQTRIRKSAQRLRSCLSGSRPSPEVSSTSSRRSAVTSLRLIEEAELQ